MKDFDLKKIAESGQIFRSYETSPGYWTFISRNKRITLNENEDIFQQLKELSESEEDYDFWINYFDLDRNYEAIRQLATKNCDTFMELSCEAGIGIRILKQDPWEMLISFIISQRKSIPSIRNCIEKLCTAFGDSMGNFYAFPTPEQLYDANREKLAACGLGYRLEYIIDAATRVYHGTLALDDLQALSDEEMSAKLKEVHGVGDKVANCIMLFAYARTGRVPVDTWVKKIMEEEYGGDNPFPKYGEYAGIMQQYAFYYKREK